MLFPYLLLFAAITAALYRCGPWTVWALVLASLIPAIYLGAIAPEGLLSVGLGIGLALVPMLRPDNRTLLICALTGAGLLALASVFRLLPGFPALTLVDGFGRDGQGALAWRYDKGFAGFVLVWLHRYSGEPAGRLAIRLRLILLPVGTAILLLLAAFVGLGTLTPALVTGWWLWILGNIYLTVVAEEALFRGLIQRGLGRFFRAWGPNGYAVAIGLTAILFGAVHLPWGLDFAVLAGLAGAYYGVLYGRSHSLAWAIAGHALLNACILILMQSPFA